MEKLSLILLLDDDDITNYLNKLFVTDLALAENVETAGNGEEAMEIIDNYCSDRGGSKGEVLILVDINMPEMDGFEFLETIKRFKEVYKNLNVALLSSLITWKDKQKANQYHILDIVAKPLTTEKLEKLVGEVWSRKILS